MLGDNVRVILSSKDRDAGAFAEGDLRFGEVTPDCYFVGSYNDTRFLTN